MKRSVALCSAVWSLAAAAVEPQQFAQGIELQADAQRPLLELALPDAVYAGVTRADLSDLRVFNAEGIAVPHALCEPPSAPPRVERRALPVFPLQAARAGQGSGVDVQVRGGADSAVRVEVEPAAPAPRDAPTARSGYVIDARALPGEIRALHLQWRTADAASEVAVRVEASDDLDRWHSVVERTTLLRADAGAAVLERAHIPLPQLRYAYLRLVRVGAGPAPQIDGAIAEISVAAAQDDAELRWFDAAPQALPPTLSGGFGYDAGRHAPLRIARIELPQSNMVVGASLQSRASAQAPWQTHWSGEVFTLGDAAQMRRNADPRFAPTRDRHWRVLVTANAESLGRAAPRLQLGYRAQNLRFLAQGSPPFLLAYGSVQAPRAPVRDCAELLRVLPGDERAALLGAARTGAPRTLGGAAALAPAPQPLPLRRIALWSLLALGALLLVAMALSLLRRMRT